jgi:hypothetical protein
LLVNGRHGNFLTCPCFAFEESPGIGGRDRLIHFQNIRATPGKRRFRRGGAIPVSLMSAVKAVTFDVGLIFRENFALRDHCLLPRGSLAVCSVV